MNGLKNISFEKDTKQINDDVKIKIASHLWLFCGYNDSIYPALNSDAKYIKAIYDLYNVIIDSSLITNLNSIAVSNNWKYLKDIEDIRETINMLRTVGGHTVSLENVRHDVILEFKKWEINQCGTDKPSEERDFEKLIDGLLKIENLCINIVNHFINDASGLTGTAKDKLISKWEKSIIDYYFKSAHSNMFENKLIEWYRMDNTGTFSQGATNKAARNFAVSTWIMDKIYLKEQKELDLLIKTKTRIYPKLQPEQQGSLDQRIQEKRNRIEAAKNEVAKYVNKSIENLQPSDYRKHYLSKDALGKKMNYAIPEIKNQGLTLLPQDLFGYIIKIDMK